MPRKKFLEDFVEVSIVRKRSQTEGRLIMHLKESEKGASEMIMQATSAFYIPFLLHAEGVRGEEFHFALHNAIADLEVQIVKLKRAFGMEGLAQLVLVQPSGAGVPSILSGVVQPTIGPGVTGGTTPGATNLVPPGVSFFGQTEVSTEPRPVQPVVASQPLVVSQMESGEDSDDENDDSWLDDEEDVIPSGSIETDPGFRLE